MAAGSGRLCVAYSLSKMRRNRDGDHVQNTMHSSDSIQRVSHGLKEKLVTTTRTIP